MMKTMLAVTALSAATASAKSIVTPEMKENLSAMQRDGLKADSSLGRKLISQARRTEEAQAQDMSFVANYSIKFIGCHHVTQWNSDEEQQQQENNGNNNNGNNGQNGENENALNAANGRIRSKGLVRFRLCPADSCFDHFGQGCSANYGEYVVDMVTFVKSYIEWQMENMQTQCATYRNTCYTQCYESSNGNCYSNCYGKYGVNAALCNNGDGNGDAYDAYGNVFSLDDYLECGEYNINNADGEEIAYYLGPYCANQGGDVRLGFFQDQYCTLPSDLQANYFEKLSGVEIPYTKQSLVTTSCLTCEATQDQAEAQNGNDYYNYDADGNRNYYYAQDVNDLCSNMYLMSGKCETEFSKDDVPYPEEGACTYVESIKRLKDDGIIRSDQKISSKPASIAIGVFTGLACMLGGYVYYLKSKIARSRVNLAGATTSLA